MFVSQTSFRGETNGGVVTCRQFSQAKFYKEMSQNDWALDKLVLSTEQKNYPLKVAVKLAIQLRTISSQIDVTQLT